MTVEITKKARMRVKLKLLVVPLRFRNVLWLVAEEEMDDVLLGRSLMKYLGFVAAKYWKLSVATIITKIPQP